MNNKYLKPICVLSLMGLVLGNSVTPVLGHDYMDQRGGYDYDQIIEIENPDWMASLSDSMRISWMSIPGTHDTMSRCDNANTCGTDLFVKWWVKCQSFTLSDQLRIGIRALDIRCRHYQDRFAIHHGKYHVDDMWFDTNVLEPLIIFLYQHPTETVLMRIKPEHVAADNTRTFCETFEWYKSRYPGLIWEPTGENPNPTLREVRGKIVILDDFSILAGCSSGNNYGINWSDSSGFVRIQDHWNLLDGPHDMADKLVRIYMHLMDAVSGRMNDIFINFLSGVGDGPDWVGATLVSPFPWFVASGHISEGLVVWGEPGTDGGHQTYWGKSAPGECGPFYHPSGVRLVDRCIFTGMPDLFLEMINRRSNPKRVGIIMADFPSDLLADAIIDTNPTYHGCDYNPPDWALSLSELLRTIQFYNSGGYSCDPQGEDGFAPGGGDQTCRPHASDYNPQDWSLNLSELLRAIQFYNSAGYHPDPTSEDGFAPGL